MKGGGKPDTAAQSTASRKRRSTYLELRYVLLIFAVLTNAQK